jgi:ribonuclease HI
MKIKDLSYFTVYTDGGCLGNGGSNPQCYGSYKVIVGNVEQAEEVGKFVSRAQYPDLHTNNEAEYRAVIDALTYIKDLLARMGTDKHDSYPITIVTDSALVVGQVGGTKKCKAPNLQSMHQTAKDLAVELDACFRHTFREDIVNVLGH